MYLLPTWISIKTSLTATVITFILGIFMAYAVTNYKGRFKDLIDSVLMLPMVLPPTVVGFFLLIILGKNGTIGKILYKIGLQVIFSWEATVIAATVVSFPIMYKTTRAAFEQIDENIVNAALTLGLSKWKIFHRIIVPISWPGIGAGTVLAFVRALGEFGATLLIAGNIPGKTQTIPLAIFFAAEGGQMNKAFVLVLLISTVSLMVMLGFNYWTKYQNKFRKKY